MTKTLDIRRARDTMARLRHATEKRFGGAVDTADVALVLDALDACLVELGLRIMIDREVLAIEARQPETPAEPQPFVPRKVPQHILEELNRLTPEHPTRLGYVLVGIDHALIGKAPSPFSTSALFVGCSTPSRQVLMDEERDAVASHLEALAADIRRPILPKPVEE